MKTNNLFGGLAIAMICLFTTSCDDNRLAKEIAGSWTFTYSPENDEGVKETVVETLTFTYVDDISKDGGTFVERLDGKMEDMEIEDLEGSYYNCKYHSSIKGEYEIIAGDLYLYYDKSSLEVKVGAKDIELDLDEDARRAVISLDATEKDLREEMVEDLQKEIHTTLREQYADKSKDDAYENIEISGSNFTMTTSNMGRITYTRK